jgi:light-regulated signal transduction histidine kinase (bacteriophytochrome)
MDKSDREISEFLLRACHDLRSSLRAVRIHSELIRKDAGAGRNSDLEQRIGFIVEGVTSIDSLVEGLTKYSVALQTETAPFQSVHMEVQLRSVLARLHKELGECRAEVTHGELPVVSGNPDRLMQVLENLLHNALVHRGTGAPRIDVRAGKHAEGWLFTVRDNGPGVEATALERIFVAFERLPNRNHMGAGLGLAICRVIVERHGGRIWAQSQEGCGATFCFTLPEQRL